jgi:hypothetical protein
MSRQIAGSPWNSLADVPMSLQSRLGRIFEEGAIAFTESTYSSLHRGGEFMV